MTRKHDKASGTGSASSQLGGASAGDFRDIALRVKGQVKKDRLGIVAAGVAFYGFLAIFPALAAVISVWGLVSDPSWAREQLSSLDALPSSVQDLLSRAGARIAESSPSKLGWSAVISILVALWSANKGTKSLMEAVALAHGERDDRGLLKKNALALALTVGAMLMVILALGVVVVIPPLVDMLALPGSASAAISVGRWVLLSALTVVALSALFRVSPPHYQPSWRWVSPGSVLATGLWIAASLAFSFYTANFGRYDALYGSLSAVVILLVWFFLSAFVVLLGAEWNAESERLNA